MTSLTPILWRHFRLDYDVITPLLSNPFYYDVSYGVTTPNCYDVTNLCYCDVTNHLYFDVTTTPLVITPCYYDVYKVYYPATPE